MEHRSLANGPIPASANICVPEIGYLLTVMERSRLIGVRQTKGGSMDGKTDRRAFLKLSTSTAALGAFGALPAKAQAGSTLTLAWDTDIDSLDPHVFKSVGGYAVQCNLYDPLVSWKVRPVEGVVGLSRSFPNEFEGSIAQSWTFERDGATVVLEIRPGMTFPSGRPVNAAAFKYSLDRALQSPGYMRFVMPRMLQISKPDDIEVRDDSTVAINMKG